MRHALLTGTLLATALLASATRDVHAAAQHRQTSHFQDGDDLRARLNALAAADRVIDEIAVTPGGEWVIVADDDVWHSDDFPASPLAKIEQFVDAGRRIDAVAFTPTGNWAVIAEDLDWRSAGLPHTADLDAVVDARQAAGKRIDDLAFTSNGLGWVLLSEGYYHGYAVPSSLWAALTEQSSTKRRPDQVSIAADGRWLLTATQWYASSGLIDQAVNSVRLFQRAQYELDRVVLGVDGDYILYAADAFAPSFANPRDRIEYGLKASAASPYENIWERMQSAGIPGVSIAVIDDNEVSWARGYGELEAGTQAWVRTSSPFDIASLSKFLGALAAMIAVDDNLIDLTTDAQDLSFEGTVVTNPLRQWRQTAQANPVLYQTGGVALPENLTLERLLSHSASLVPGSSTSFDAGEWDATPGTTGQLLLGYDCLGAGCNLGGSNTVWYDPSIGVPGSAYQYAGGGFLVMQAALEWVTGQAFPAFLDDRVFDALGMADSSCSTTMSAAFAARVATAHDGNGAALSDRVYPWCAAGGVFSTPRDYARAMIVLMNDGRREDDAAFLPEVLVDEMLTDHAPGGQSYGLGVGVSAGGGFSHTGSHTGRAYTRMLGSDSRDQGIVIFVNTHDAANEDVEGFVGEIVNAYRCAYGWTNSGC